MIGILNYGLGNIGAFANVFTRLHIPLTIVTQPSDLDHVSKVILPGVGAFDHAMDKLNRSGLRPKLSELVLGRGISVLGICVGMQMLADSSEEGVLPGLGWIPGRVTKLKAGLPESGVRLPHMGWNDINLSDAGASAPLFQDLQEGSRFYFLHSYYFAAEHHQDVLATVEYGPSLTAAVGKNNVFGVQFHPEKSHRFGVRLLQNFADC